MIRPRWRHRPAPWRQAIFLLLGVVAAGAHANVAPPKPAEFDICQGCHGVAGQGNPELGAPRIAGLDALYIGRQLASFRDGPRGAADGDTYGAQMRRIAALLDDTAIGRLSAYVGALAEVPAPATLAADATAGATAYTACAVCHGERAEGSAQTAAPRLAGMSDWYLLRQFSAFASGARGGAGDEGGAAMRAVAAAGVGDATVADVIAHAVSLPGNTAGVQAACADGAPGSCDASAR